MALDLAVTSSKQSFLLRPDAITWLVGLGTTLALAGQSAAFWMVGALTGAGKFNAQQAGLTVTAEMVAMGLMMTIISPIVHRLPRRGTIIASIAIILATQLGSALVDDFWPFIAMRVFAGLGFGILFSLTSAIGAGTAAPERTFALAGSISLVIGTAINPLLGFGSQTGISGVFFALLSFCLMLALPLMFLVVSGKSDTVGIKAATSVAQKVPMLPAAGVMALMALMAGATNGVFVFVGKIASDVGVGGPSMGLTMAGVSLFSASGGLVANRIGTRYGTLQPLITGLLLIGANLCWLANASSAAAFWFSFTSVVTLYWFTFPYILGLASSVDPYGRVASATGTAKIFAGGIGAAISGTVVEWVGIGAYGFVALGLIVIAVLVASLVVNAARHHSIEPKNFDQ